MTEIVTDLSNWALLRAAIHGHTELQRSVSTLRLPGISDFQFVAEDPATLGHGSPVMDWIGINYYTRNSVRFEWFQQPVIAAPDGPNGDNGWVVYPEGIERIIRDTATRFPGIPIVITENGMSDGQDRLRPQLIRDTLRFLDQARRAHDGEPGIDVRGYYHWSLTDNFEWESGYSQRFGLVQIDYQQNQNRTPRASAQVYSEEVRARSPASRTPSAS